MPTRSDAVRLDRRTACAALGSAALAALLPACSSSSSPDAADGSTTTIGAGTSAGGGTTPGTATTPGTGTAAVAPLSDAALFDDAVCTVIPEIGDGPFYLDLDLVRRDITEGQEGLPFRMLVRVVDTTEECAPIEGVAVEVWQANAEGWYSGYVGVLDPPTAAPPTHEEPTDDLTFLRGTQLTDADGVVAFDSIYPSWYLGRTNHVHVKVHLSGGRVATTQLFFDQAVSDEVATQEPYASHTGQDTTNATDHALASVADPALVMWRLLPDGDGYLGTITIGIGDA